MEWKDPEMSLIPFYAKQKKVLSVSNIEFVKARITLKKLPLVLT